MRRWVPQGLADTPVYIFETGGSTGVPKSRINIDDFRIDYEMFSDTLPDAHFPKGSDWLMVGPSGPRRLRLAVEHLAQHRGGICFCVDLDPRWVIKLIKARQMDQVGSVQAPRHRSGAHAAQGARQHPLHVHHAEAARGAGRADLAAEGRASRGIFCGGTEMTPQFHRWVHEEVLEGIYFAPTYGNTLMGLAVHKPLDPADNYAIIYYPPRPRAVLEVVDPDEPDAPRRLRRDRPRAADDADEEFFMPRFLERDEAEREPPCDAYPWDGVRNVRPFRRLGASVTEGVY